MSWVIVSVTQDHDFGLVALACLIGVMTIRYGSGSVGTGSSETRPFGVTVSHAAFVAGIWAAYMISVMGIRTHIGAEDVASSSFVAAVAALLPATALVFVTHFLRQAAWTIPLAFTAAALGVAVLDHIVARALLPEALPSFRGTTAALPALIATAGAVVGLWRGATGVASIGLALSIAGIHLAAPAQAGTTVRTVFAFSHPALALMTGGVALAALVLVIRQAMLRASGAATAAEDAAQHWRRLADATFEGIMFEQNGVITDSNAAMCRLMGVEAGTLHSIRLDSIFDRLRLQSAPNQPLEHELLCPDGQRRMVEVLWRNDPRAGGRVLAVRDVTREKAAQLQIHRKTMFDSLTGLPNREQFEYFLRNSLSPTARVALLYVSIDRFESVHELYGPAGTDEALIIIACRLSETARTTGLVARIGDDDFAVIQQLDETDPVPVALAAEIVASLASPMDIDGHIAAVTASIGMAVSPVDGTTAPTLFHSARMALRQARQEGRGRWAIYTAEVELRQQTRLRMQKELSLALAEAQFSVHYQPFFHADTLDIAGCEALLRWNHPGHGPVQPSDFIPVAEETGLIVPIGQWALMTACAEAAAWDRPLTIAVNLSPVQFSHDGLVEDVASVLAETGLPPERLELEITETTIMADAQNAARILTALKRLGVRIAMDDFGTGQSSLGNLRKFPFDKIKIDRSFISDDDADAEMIVHTIIAMGHGLGLTVTAEGVETNRQMAMLRDHGCTYMQGYLLGRPVPVSQLDLAGSPFRWLKPASASSGTPSGSGVLHVAATAQSA